MILTITSKSLKGLHLSMYAKIKEGWKIIKQPHKSIFNGWVCKLEKDI